MRGRLVRHSSALKYISTVYKYYSRKQNNCVLLTENAPNEWNPSRSRGKICGSRDAPKRGKDHKNNDGNSYCSAVYVFLPLCHYNVYLITNNLMVICSDDEVGACTCCCQRAKFVLPPPWFVYSSAVIDTSAMYQFREQKSVATVIIR